MVSPAITLVTVVFAGETNLLRLQARSIALFAEDALIDDIVIVLNDKDETALKNAIKTSILPEYGSFVSKVRFQSGGKLVGGPAKRLAYATSLKA